MEYSLRGYREFLVACAASDKAAQKEVRSILRSTGDRIVRDATRRFDAYDVKSAHGYRTAVRQRGISVEQRLRKTTGRRPDFGALQMRRALLPALAENQEHFEKDMEHALDLIADVFEYGSY